MATQAPAKAPAPTVPFPVASRLSQAQNFTIPSADLNAGIVNPPGTPVQVAPNGGYLAGLRMEITVTLTGTNLGATTLLADAPWNLLNAIQITDSAGNPITSVMTGYDLYLMNKYLGFAKGLATPFGIEQDPAKGNSFGGDPTTGTLHFFLDLTQAIDQRAALGALPNLAGNRTYQINLSYSALSTIFGVAPNGSASVVIDASATYWTQPTSSPFGTPQTTPYGLGSFNLTRKEVQPLVAGENLIQSHNVGSIIRALIFVFRDSTGDRTGAIEDIGNIVELLIDQFPAYRIKYHEWIDAIGHWYGFGPDAGTPGNLDTGVFPLPFFLLAGGTAGDQSSPKSQYLTSQNTTVLQLHPLNLGAALAGGNLAILTNAVQTPNPSYIYSPFVA